MRSFRCPTPLKPCTIAAILDEFEHPELTLPSVVDSAAGSERMPNKTPALRFPSISLDRAQSPNPRVSGPSCAADK